MVHPNIFRPRNDWNVVLLKSKRINNVKFNAMNHFEEQVVDIIKKETGSNPLLNKKYRGGHECQSRQLFLAMMTKHTKGTLKDIGRLLGKDHSTVLHAIKAVNNMYDTDKQYRAMYDRINEKIKLIK